MATSPAGRRDHEGTAGIDGLRNQRTDAVRPAIRISDCDVNEAMVLYTYA